MRVLKDMRKLIAWLGEDASCPFIGLGLSCQLSYNYFRRRVKGWGRKNPIETKYLAAVRLKILLAKV